MTGKTVFTNGIPHVIEIVEKPNFYENYGGKYHPDTAGILFMTAMQQYEKAIEPQRIRYLYKRIFSGYAVLIDEKYHEITESMTVDFDRTEDGAVITKIN